MKRILTTLLALSLVLMLIPSMAFATVKTNISGATVTLYQDTYTYTGKECKPTVIKISVGGGEVPISDCDITYTGNINAGNSAKVSIVAKNTSATFEGSTDANFKINPADLASTTYDQVTVPAGTATDDITYNKINLKLGDFTVAQADFDIPTTPDHSIPGTNYTMTLSATANKNFTGTKQFSFKAATDLSGYNVTPSTQSFEYDGNAKTYNYVTVAQTGIAPALTLGTDYIVKYENNYNASGNAPKLIVEGVGKYFGKVEKNFAITSKMMNYSNFSIENIGNVVKGTSPEPKVYFGSRQLIKSQDFNYSYASYGDSIKVTVTGINNFYGSIEKTFSTGLDLVMLL